MAFVMSAGLVQVETSAGLLGGRTEDRYALIQNCFRYFDLSNVGTSAAHLSLFQMPGAFTFGPLGKRESIAQIWHLLRQVFGLPAESLWATCFAGGYVAGRQFEPDVEAQQAWRAVGLAPDHIVLLGAEHNFWKQGASVVGKAHMPKCGPNTEVFFDRGRHLACGPVCQPGCRCGRFVEFLNTLFITFHIDERADRVKFLDEPFTETVIGAERVAMLVQNVSSVFEIDVMRPVVQRIRASARPDRLSSDDQVKHERILADHSRALLFLTADGAPPPGRGGRARLMRKLVRELLTSQRLLGITEPDFVPALIQTVAVPHADQNPHLIMAQPRVLNYIAIEQNQFERTLETGRRQLAHLLRQRGDQPLSSQDVIEMEKRHGVPRALLESMLV
jgi:alanyl-tRNA synthetase